VAGLVPWRSNPGGTTTRRTAAGFAAGTQWSGPATSLRRSRRPWTGPTAVCHAASPRPGQGQQGGPWPAYAGDR